MSGKNANASTASDQPRKKAKSKPKNRKEPRNEGVRETVESIAIAFALAFVFKTFQAEAYVIPTGSMAPTLYGRHKEVCCDGCGYEFAVGASTEIDQFSGQLVFRISDVFCSNCGKVIDARDAPVFNGDRIVVNKQIHEFKRFDVVVFKNPEQGHVNYIKRLVGLPGESIRIRQGDLWAKTSESAEWEIQRKDDPNVQKAIQLVVYDDNAPARPLLERGWPERWVAAQPSDSEDGWQETEENWVIDREARTYSVSSGEDQWNWIRYRHYQPNAAVWENLEELDDNVSYAAPSLISDFCSFNAFRHPRGFRDIDPTGAYWVGDLTINANIEIIQASEKASLQLQLVEGPQTFNATIDVASGKVSLTKFETADGVDSEDQVASGQTSSLSSGRHDFAFANVDDRICLWVDGQLVEFDRPTTYVSSDLPAPGPADLAPCGIAVQGAEVKISDLLLERDIYYQNEFIPFHEDEGLSFYTGSGTEVRNERELQSLLTNPIAYGQRYRDEVAAVLSQGQHYCEYELADDEYLMFGDNSPMSKDGRLFDYQTRPMNGVFSHRYAVREKDMIGKALFIFWPHGVPFLNDGKGVTVWSHKGDPRLDPGDYPWMRVPFYPNISRMEKIR